mmetsp:Transcript_15829/g.23157  ORF Transcript_15829/g.23157 Transcript_15829/m.23157 type:complete len:294 (-) Transcript_15829:1237-2118(-)
MMRPSKVKGLLKLSTLLAYTSLLSLVYFPLHAAADNQVYWDQDSHNDVRLATAQADHLILDSRSNLRSSSSEQRRALSFWSSFMSFLHCPPVPGFHHDENNAHCHHHHSNNGGGSHSSSGHSNSGGSDGCGDDGCEEDNVTNDDGCGDDGCGAGDDDTDDDTDDDANYGSATTGAPSVSASPSAVSDKMSNDVWGWWNGPNDRNSSESNYDSIGSEVVYGIGAIGMGVAGFAVAASLVLKRRNHLSASSTVSRHPLNGAVAGRKKTFKEIFGKSSKVNSTGERASPVTNYVQA